MPSNAQHTQPLQSLCPLLGWLCHCWVSRALERPVLVCAETPLPVQSNQAEARVDPPQIFFFNFLIKYTLISQGAETQRSYLHLPRFCSSPVVPANFVHMQNGPMGDIWHPLIFNLENGKKKLNYDKLIYLCSQCCQLQYFSGIFCRLLKSAEQGDKIQRL